MSKGFGVFFLIVGTVAVVGGLFTGEFLIFFLGGFLLAGGILGLAYGTNKTKSKKQQQEQAALRQQENLLKQQENLAVDFYDDCVKRKIIKNNVVVDQDGLMLIAKQSKYNLPDLASAGKMLSFGRSVKYQRQQQEAQQKREQANNKEKELYNQETEKSKVWGKDKYIKTLKEDLVQIEAAVNSSKGSITNAQSMQTYTARTKDPTTSAAWYSAVAGTAAGLAEASKVMESNRRAEENAAYIRKAAYEIEGFERQELSRLLDQKTDIKDAIKRIEDKLIDDSDPYEKLSLITLHNSSFSYTEGGNINAALEISVKAKKLLDNDAILDGSLRIDLQNANGTIAASGIYNAPGHGECFLNNVGFNRIRKINVVCLPTEQYSANIDFANLKVVLVPLHLWLIEGKQYSRKSEESAIETYLKNHGWSYISDIKRFVPELQETPLSEVGEILQSMHNKGTVIRQTQDRRSMYSVIKL